MADNVSITPGSGATVATDDVSGVQFQKIKVDMGGDGLSVPLVGDATYGLPVDLKRIAGGLVFIVNNPTAANLKVDASGVAVPITDNSGSLTVDAPAATPVAVRLSTGSAFIDTIPVSGTVTAAQGSPAVAANRWLVQLHDGTTGATVDSGTGGLKVAIVSGGGSGTSLADKATFTEGTTTVTPIGGEFIASPSAPSDGHAAAVRITAARGLHANLRDNSGVEVGTSGNALRIDPTGATAQPVTQSVANWTINQVKMGGANIAVVGTGIQQVSIVDSLGAALNAANPLYVKRGGRGTTRVTKSVALTASQTGQPIWTPASGKKFFIDKIVLSVTTAGPLILFDQTNAAANTIADSGSGVNWPTGVYVINFDEPWPSSTNDNILNYTSGAGLVAKITTHGYEV